MNSQDFFYIVMGITLFFAIWYILSWTQRPKPTELNLSAPDSAPVVLNPENGQSVGNGAQLFPAKEGLSKGMAESRYSIPRPSTLEKRPSKNLNIIFNYNGHSWDAYEILGVPAGASIVKVTEAYQASIDKADPESLPFLEAAYKAILSKS